MIDNHDDSDEIDLPLLPAFAPPPTRMTIRWLSIAAGFRGTRPGC
jgi:hypothetical protein